MNFLLCARRVVAIAFYPQRVMSNNMCSVLLLIGLVCLVICRSSEFVQDDRYLKVINETKETLGRRHNGVEL